jgi:glycosyltransferase involved in cell wall biosynthesis
LENTNTAETKILTIIPAYNEEKTIKSTVEAIKSIDHRQTIVVVDDGSIDDTYNQASGVGVTIIRNMKNVGKGGAIDHALKSIEEDFDIVLLVDADIGHSASCAKKLLEPVIEGEADMTIGRLPMSKKKSGFGLVRWLAEKSIYLKTGESISSSLSGQRAINLNSLKSVTISRGFGLEVGLTIDFLNAGYRIKEIDVEMKHIGTGKSIGGFMHRGKQFYEIFKTVWLKRK